METAVPAAPVAEMVESAAESTAPVAPAEPVAAAPVQIPPVDPPVAETVEDPYPEGDPFAGARPKEKEASESVEPTRRIRFDKLDELKFGTNYNSGK